MGKKVGVSKWCRAGLLKVPADAARLNGLLKAPKAPEQNRRFCGSRETKSFTWLPDFSGKGQITFEFLIAIIFIIFIFVYGVMLFEDKNSQNVVFNYKWNAQLTADRLARNINNVYLMDNNSTYQEYFYWKDSGRTVSVSEHAVLAWWDEGSYSDSPIVAKLDWQVSDVNGLLIFEKINNGVVVKYG